MKHRSGTRMAQGHNAAFLIEMTAIVLILFVVMGITIHVFSASSLSLHESSHRSAAVSQATLIAQRFEQADSDESFCAAIDGTLNPSTHVVTTQPQPVSADCSVTTAASVKIETEPAQTGTMLGATITIANASTGQVLYTLHSSRFVSNRGGGTL